MAEKLSLSYDRIGDILYIEVAPYRDRQRRSRKISGPRQSHDR